jgi:hypothetical protein
LVSVFHKLEFDPILKKFNFLDVKIGKTKSIRSFDKPDYDSLADMYDWTLPRNSDNEGFLYELNYTRGNYETYKNTKLIDYDKRPTFQ